VAILVDRRRAPASAYTARDRLLERALVVNFVMHGIAMVGMATLLLPMLPGGWSSSDAERCAQVAAHAWRFRLGWLPWQGCAVADLGLAIAMVRTPWIPRLPALFVLVMTIAAVAPDQYAQALWITRGVELSRTDTAAYLAFERHVFPLTAGWGALLYTTAAVGWSWSFARAGTWSRTLTLLSITTWATMFVAALSPLVPEAARPNLAFVAIANAIGFIQLQVWLGLVAEDVLTRARPDEPFGSLARFRYPGSGLFARLIDTVANSRLLRILLERIPLPEMDSDVTDVVYVNYLVPADALAPMVPEGLELQRLGPMNDVALFTFLTFRHGHFGFAFLAFLAFLGRARQRINQLTMVAHALFAKRD